MSKKLLYILIKLILLYGSIINNINLFKYNELRLKSTDFSHIQVKFYKSNIDEFKIVKIINWASLY